MPVSRTRIIVPAVAVSLVLLISGRATAINVHESWIEHIKGSVYYVHSRTDESINNSNKPFVDMFSSPHTFQDESVRSILKGDLASDRAAKRYETFSNSK